MNHEQELPADLDNLIAGLRIENINLKLEAKQTDALLREMRAIFSIPPYWHERIDALLASQQGEQTVDEKNDEILRKFSAWVNDEHPEQAEGAQGERERFRANYKHLDLSEKPDAWGRTQFLHSHVEALWQGWSHRAALAQPSPAPELERPRRYTMSTIDAQGKDTFLRVVPEEDFDRIARALRAERDGAIKLIGQSIWQKFEQLTQERDAAQARVAELEQCLYQMQEAAKSLSAPAAQAGQVPEEWRDMLANLQWHYRDHDDHWHRPQGYYCPQCGGEQSAGHKDGCELAALLAAAPAQGGE